MATTPTKPDARVRSATGFVYLPLIAGWLVPGAGHFLLRKWTRGALLFVVIVSMFALGLAMQGKLYTGAQDILELLGVAGDLGSGLLYLACRTAGPGADPVQKNGGRLRHAVYRRRGPLKHHRSHRRAQPTHGEEAVVFHPSHFAAVVLFSLFASTVFGITMRSTPRTMVRYGAYCFVLFSGSAVVLSWVMYLIAR